jgi:hypothetical protein
MPYGFKGQQLISGYFGKTHALYERLAPRAMIRHDLPDLAVLRFLVNRKPAAPR